MKILWKYIFLTVFVSAIFFISCEKEDPNLLLIKQMESVTDSLVQHANVTGIVALVVDHQKGINWIYTSGYSDMDTKQPMNHEYIFRIGSNTKTMTGTVLLQLVDEDRLSLEDKLSDFFPEFHRSNEVTIAMLCNMTSGIFSYTDDEGWGNEIENNPTREWTPGELVAIAFSHDYNFDSGTDWHYSNTNTILLGMIIEKLTGNSLQSEVENRLMSPLSLNNTVLLTSGTDLPSQHCKGYIWNEDEGEYSDVTNSFNVSWAWAAGSAHSTPRELQKYVQILVGGGYLSENLQNKRLTELRTIRPNTAYGYAICRMGSSFFGHNGGLPGYTSSMYHSKEKNCTVIIYFNCYAAIHPDYLFFRFMDIMYEGVF